MKAAGLQLLLDFHYSDYRADPGKQFKPAAWHGKDMPALIWPEGSIRHPDSLASLIYVGIRGVKAADPGCQIMLQRQVPFDVIGLSFRVKGEGNLYLANAEYLGADLRKGRNGQQLSLSVRRAEQRIYKETGVPKRRLFRVILKKMSKKPSQGDEKQPKKPKSGP